MRHKWTILTVSFCIAVLVYGLLCFATPSYVAQAEVRIDMPQPHVLDNSAAVLPSDTPTLEGVNTEMAALASPALAKAAAVALGLTTLREFELCPPQGFSARLPGFIRHLIHAPDPGAAVCTESADYAGRALLGRMSFTNDHTSYVIQINATASDALLAAHIANGYARAYVGWQRDRRAGLAGEADEWLTHRLADMHGRMLAADSAVEAYRIKHKLIGTHAAQVGQPPDTLRTAQLSQFGAVLGDTTATLTQKSSTLAQVQAAIHSGHYDQVASAQQSPVVQSLLERRGELTGQLAQLRTKYGADYPTVKATTAELARNEAQLRAETERVAAALSGEVGALAASRASIGAHVSQLEGVVAGESQDDVKLAELEREAATDRSVYESLFVRLTQVDAERVMQRADADIVVEAAPPTVPVYPQKTMMTVGAFMASVGIGAALAFVREMTSSRFRDADHVEEEIGLPVVGLFARRPKAPQSIGLDDPHSVEAETIHATLTRLLGGVNAPRRESGLVVLVTSALPREGKSCFSVALARAAASAGLSVFALDCDIRHPSMSELVEAGGPEMLTRDLQPMEDPSDPAALAAAIIRQARTDLRCGMRYLSLSEYISNPRGLLTWPGLPLVLRELRDRYDIVIMDAPPVLAVSDAMHLGPMADRVLMMIDWQETPRQATSAAVRALHRAGVGITGAVMTKVDMRTYAKYGGSHAYFVGNTSYYLRPAA